mgnify:CR=1 FL=1|jgi:hypothetical protein|tara:strand:+ start:2859 stop:3599 length:741 start_codon:yes stop_codon:yes gene_type:complete
MASVNEVYSALKNLANKDERGFITPKVFNTFSTIAQNKIFNDLFNEMTKAQTLRARNIDAKTHMSFVKRVEEDLSNFSKEETVSQSSGVFNKPEDLARVISMKTHGTYVFGSSTSTPIDVIYDESKIEYILQSDLSAPSVSHPVALLSEAIEVFPTTIKKIKVRYYKYPEGRLPSTGARTALSPRYNAILLGATNEVFDPTTSVDFEMPDHYVPQLIIEIGKMVGINLRDQDVFAYTSGESQQQKQ